MQVLGEEVTTNLFALLGASAAIGRVFGPDEDDPGGRRVVILTDAFWRAKFGGDRAVVGRTLTFNGEPYAVIGVMPPGFRALSEAAQPDTYSERTHLSEVAVRAAGTEPHALLPAIQRTVWSIDPSQPITNVLTMDEVIAGSTAERRFNMTLLTAVALLALGLAIVGVYGVAAHAAVQRTREIGIRIALGAGRRHVLSLVIASGLRWAVLGVVAGLAGAYAGTRFLAAMLFGITPTDPATFAGLAALMLGVAALASYVPARRAASVNPISALRGD